MPNELTVGTIRVGDFIDFYEETPQVKATLERSEQGISVVLSWSEPDSPYAFWFLGADTFRITNAGRPAAAAPPPPKRALFYDSHGFVLLTRCWPRGYHTHALGPGTGRLWAKAAILDVNRDIEFDKPHGLRTEISGLREWLGVTSWEQTVTWQGEATAALSSKRASSIEVGSYRGLTISLVPTWQIQPDPALDRRIVLDLLYCTTRSSTGEDWGTHLHAHRAFRDLLVISRWQPESCVEAAALREDDPLLTMDGKEHGDQWREVIVPQDERTPQPAGYRPHLIKYEDLKEAGLLRWLTLRDQFARALDPVISSIDLREVTPSALLAQTGPGLEALGYLLLLRDGVSAKKAAATPLKVRLERILNDLHGCLPFDGSTWARSTVEAYNGLKHANRDEPDPVDMINAWRESILVTRTWVALELGVPPTAAKERLQHDPQRHPYQKTL